MLLERKLGAWVTACDAAHILGVTDQTVRIWCRLGRIKCQRRAKKSGVVVLMVKKSCLTRRLFTQTCRYCGREFMSPRPRKAYYCCAAHRTKWFTEFYRTQTTTHTRTRRPAPSGPSIKRQILKSRRRDGIDRS